MVTGQGDGYGRLIEIAYRSVSIYDGPEVFLQQFRPLPAHIRHLLACHWFYSEFTNGGFIQFFYNDTGVLAPEATDGMNDLGLDGPATVLRQAMSHFGAPYSRDRSTRMTTLDETPSIGRSLELLDHAFNHCLGDIIEDHGDKDYMDRFYQVLNQYARRHRT